MTAELHPAAAKELDRIVDWYDQRSSSAGDNFLHDFRSTVELVLQHPLSGPETSGGRRRILFRWFPYFIGYRVIGEVIRIVAISHTSRRPNYWLRRK